MELEVEVEVEMEMEMEVEVEVEVELEVEVEVDLLLLELLLVFPGLRLEVAEPIEHAPDAADPPRRAGCRGRCRGAKFQRCRGAGC